MPQKTRHAPREIYSRDRGPSRRGGFAVFNARFITVGKHHKSLTSKKQHPPTTHSRGYQRHENKKGGVVKTL